MHYRESVSFISVDEKDGTYFLSCLCSLKVTTTRLDPKSKDKVILKRVKVGIKGAEEFGEFEEWFNYRLSRAAPETCAEFLGSFVADKTNSQFTKGAKWLVWKFEGDLTLGDYIIDRNFP
ncbi:Serine/threonine-protein kinase stn8, chloroplastic [Trifolium repens]|nr:Serine/threonine-protein kinase stn8, chloroplastic [Trifolium repens]